MLFSVRENLLFGEVVTGADVEEFEDVDDGELGSHSKRVDIL